MKNLLLLIFVLITGMAALSAQNNPVTETGKRVTIQGFVLDINGTPVENAIVFVDGKETDTKTDADGNFNIKVRKNAVKIGVVALGTGILEQEIDGRSDINFLFERESAELQDPELNSTENEAVLSTGYSKIKQKYSAGAVGFLDVEHSKKKYSSIREILMETPGLTMINNVLVVIGSSNFDGYVSPLFVVDDMPVDGSLNLTPSEVSTVTVLKGASAAIYGSRAFGGVVIITTRIP